MPCAAESAGSPASLAVWAALLAALLLAVETLRRASTLPEDESARRRVDRAPADRIVERPFRKRLKSRSPPRLARCNDAASIDCRLVSAAARLGRRARRDVAARLGRLGLVRSVAKANSATVGRPSRRVARHRGVVVRLVFVAAGVFVSHSRRATAGVACAGRRVAKHGSDRRRRRSHALGRRARRFAADQTARRTEPRLRRASVRLRRPRVSARRRRIKLPRCGRTGNGFRPQSRVGDRVVDGRTRRRRDQRAATSVAGERRPGSGR